MYYGTKYIMEQLGENDKYKPRNITGGRPQKYKNLGPTERMRVPLYKQIETLCQVLDEKAGQGYDAVELLDSFIESMSH